MSRSKKLSSSHEFEILPDLCNTRVIIKREGGVKLIFPPPSGGGEKKSKNQKQGREIKGKERGNENEEEQKKEKKVNYKFPSTY